MLKNKKLKKEGVNNDKSFNGKKSYDRAFNS